ncbi:MAG: alkaline phosphatase D family protein [Mojavia pulchra JT2-VF2]|jgi:alkaline phosphatase D|uniref:Alkaline phosphatase D family protein n=1 Tax=Mojavia pulchra JT2-VF2 TaxID=287848 RepID=A0A951Q674_9NOST|nr:alkaline phosphatase D family protein [Mojavia pulchra JT2-VF2]
MQSFNFERLLSSRHRRRQFLIGTGALTGVAIANQWSNKVLAQPRFSNYLFSLGVASGEPLPDNVVLWTRLAPDPLNGGGMPPYNVPVQWQIATDEKMRQVVRSGTQMATPELGHSVHVEVQGLQPARWYWYRFRVGNQVSPIGRTRTAPNPRDRVNRFRFAFASCQNWQSGYYAAYKNMAQEDLDLVVHLGDYIYEGAPSTTALRQHDGNGEPFTLEEYRNRHALYKTDPNLQATHAAFPWLVTWDDHEVDNNWADEIPQDPEVQSRLVFLARRAAAFQAYYEHMPLRDFSKPRNIDMQLFRRLTFGDLVEFNVLDTRQYRTDQPCGDGRKPRCALATDPTATMTGSEQERWLFEGLDRSGARWNVIAQQTIMAQFDYDTGAAEAFNLDQWDGYVASRNRILGFIQQRRPSNPVVITGDWHSSWVNDLKANFDDPYSQTVATEFVGTSISSSCPWTFDVEAALPQNPWVKYFNGRLRGYVRCDLNRERWRTDYRLLPQSQPTGITVSAPNAPVVTAASFELPNQGVVAQV